MVEYVVAAGGSLAGFFDGFSTNPWMIGVGVGCLLLMYLVTSKG